MRKYLLAVAMLICVGATPTTKPATTQATPKPVFDLRGIKIGDQLTEDFRYNHCPAGEGQDPKSGRDHFQVGNGEVTVLYFIENRKFVGVALIFDADAFDDLLQIYRDKLGAPAKLTTSVFKKETGEKLTNIRVEWETTDGPFVMQKYENTWMLGEAQLQTLSVIKWAEEEEKSRGKTLK